MATNYLEQMLAEWYEYQGYFLRRNVWVGKRAKGGWECELDIVGFHPGRKHLVHIETSMDAQSWAKREKRYRRKFDTGRQHIPTLFKGFDLPNEIEQQAVLVFASTANRKTLGGGRIVLAADVVAAILRDVGQRSIYKQMVPEHLSVLRTLQFVAEYRDAVQAVLRGIGS